MHIPDGYLSPRTCVVFYAVMAPVWYMAARRVEKALKVKELRELLGSDVGIVVGGAPFRFDPLLWREVGADAFGRTAADAVNIVAHLAEARR